MDRREDSREKPPEDIGPEPKDTIAAEAAADVDDALDATEGADADADAVPAVSDPAAPPEDEEELDAASPVHDAEEDVLDAAEPAAEDGGADDSGASLNGAEEPARLREEAERLHREAQARQEAAAALREEASKLREEAARLLEAPQELQAEVARLREEARAAQSVLESGPELDPAVESEVEPEAEVELAPEDIAVAPEQGGMGTDQSAAETEADRKRGWRRRRRT